MRDERVVPTAEPDYQRAQVPLQEQRVMEPVAWELPEEVEEAASLLLQEVALTMLTEAAVALEMPARENLPEPGPSPGRPVNLFVIDPVHHS